MQLEVVRLGGHTSCALGFTEGKVNCRGALSAANLGGPGHDGEAQPPSECGGGLGRHTDSTICRRGPGLGCFGKVC